jgi:hypothetical protein
VELTKNTQPGSIDPGCAVNYDLTAVTYGRGSGVGRGLAVG